jgi:hypothetical protein
MDPVTLKVDRGDDGSSGKISYVNSKVTFKKVRLIFRIGHYSDYKQIIAN